MTEQNVSRMDSVAFSGFPAKSITRRYKGKGGGEWVTVYQAEQRHRLHTTLTAAVKSDESLRGKSLRLTVPGNSPASISARFSNIFDQHLLMRYGYINDPADLCTVNISELELKNFKDVNFEAFTNLVSINAASNQLTLDAFTSFPSLEELEIPLNSISYIHIIPGLFEHLQYVDLSFNNLYDEAIVALGILPALKEVHLTGNNLVTLPVEMTRPHQLQSATKSYELLSFPMLEKLWLDDNRLTDTTTFAILAGLRKLKYLYLDNNELSAIPHLKLLGSDPSSNTKSTEDEDDSKHIPDPTNVAPFPELQTLSIANNMVINSESLIPCGNWPVLNELIIVGNPIVKINKGSPKLLKEYLMNVNIIRYTQKPIHKLHLSKKAKKFKKVSSSPPPTIPKMPLLPAIESQPILALPEPVDDCFGDQENYSEESSVSSYTTCNSTERGTQGSGFFMTQPQIDDIQSTSIHSPTSADKTIPCSDNQLTVAEEFKIEQKKFKEKLCNVPKKYQGFESLLSTEDDEEYDGPPIPTDTHSCVQALKVALQHSLALTDAKEASYKSLKAETEVGKYLKQTNNPSVKHYESKLRAFRALNQRYKLQSSTGLQFGLYCYFIHGKSAKQIGPIKEQYHNIPAESTKLIEIERLIGELEDNCITAETNLSKVISQTKTMTYTWSPSKNVKNSRLSDTIVGQELFQQMQDKYNKVRSSALEAVATLDSVHKTTSDKLLNRQRSQTQLTT